MEEISNNNPVADHVPAVRLGSSLREARLRMGLSVADVAAQIRLAPRQIEALEAEEWQNLPELPFLRGFVRSYAKLLQIDAEPLLATLPEPSPVPKRLEPASVEVPFNIKQLSRQQNQIWLIATAVLLVIVIAFALWQFNAPKAAKVEKEEKSQVQESVVVLPGQVAAESSVPMMVEPVVREAVSAVQAVSAPVIAPVSKYVTAPVQAASVIAPVSKAATAPVQSAVPAVKTRPTVVIQSAVPAATTRPAVVVPSVVAAPSAVPATATTVNLHIVFDAESWAEIKDTSGKILSSRMHAAGSELNLHGKGPYELVIGHAHSVHVYRRGKEVDLMPHTNATSEVARLTLE